MAKKRILAAAVGFVWTVALLGCAPQGETKTGRPEAKRRHPKVVLGEVEHDFGMIDVSKECRYTFVVRNEGDAPLKLERGQTSCKCTMSDLPPRPIPPGGSAPVTVASKIANQRGAFRHTAGILTNDPNREVVTLAIRGAVSVILGTHPQQIVLPRSGRDHPQSVDAVVYSQAWKEFSLEEMKSSLEGLQWVIEPVDDQQLACLKARCGYRLRLTVPGGLPSGPFWQWLQISAKSDSEGGQRRTIKLDIAGDVVGRISLFGKQLAANKVLRLGAVRSDKGTRAKLTMKVYDEHRHLTVRSVQTEPEFISVGVVPYGNEEAQLGLYRVEVEIPPDTPPCNFAGAQSGRIRLLTDHPEVPVIELRVDFVVVGGQTALRQGPVPAGHAQRKADGRPLWQRVPSTCLLAAQ